MSIPIAGVVMSDAERGKETFAVAMGSSTSSVGHFDAPKRRAIYYSVNSRDS
jgi:hypothetical protein